ncbi:neuregulin [Squirrelpox virus]|uniref:C15R n=1 Tax=Squirrelpox virus TaxID=240426 RepID=Q1HTP8_9POXV|nr:neuregulin [Squirrelpox virus]ABD51488.1 C15R [Squirrelpox virus]CCD83320.1 neuregulin [Squirrelpox virus]
MRREPLAKPKQSSTRTKMVLITSMAATAVLGAMIAIATTASAQLAAPPSQHLKPCNDDGSYCGDHGVCYQLAVSLSTNGTNQMCVCEEGFTGPRCGERTHLGSEPRQGGKGKGRGNKGKGKGKKGRGKDKKPGRRHLDDGNDGDVEILAPPHGNGTAFTEVFSGDGATSNANNCYCICTHTWTRRGEDRGDRSRERRDDEAAERREGDNGETGEKRRRERGERGSRRGKHRGHGHRHGHRRVMQTHCTCVCDCECCENAPTLTTTKNF